MKYATFAWTCSEDEKYGMKIIKIRVKIDSIRGIGFRVKGIRGNGFGEMSINYLSGTSSESESCDLMCWFLLMQDRAHRCDRPCFFRQFSKQSIDSRIDVIYPWCVPSTRFFIFSGITKFITTKFIFSCRNHRHTSYVDFPCTVHLIWTIFILAPSTTLLVVIIILFLLRLLLLTIDGLHKTVTLIIGRWAAALLQQNSEECRRIHRAHGGHSSSIFSNITHVRTSFIFLATIV